MATTKRLGRILEGERDLYTRDAGKQTHMVTVLVDHERLAMVLGQKAAYTKRQQSQALRGAVVVKVRRRA